MKVGIKVGCCGFPRSKKEYFQHFKLVEVQQTFYKMPRPETALRWREEAPPDFEFSLKASQIITHPVTSPTYRKAGLEIKLGKEGQYGFFRPSDEVFRAWEQTARFALVLNARAIVFQCPPNFHESDENIKHLSIFFKKIKGSGFLFIWEPRGKWKEKTILNLCRDLSLIHCVDPFQNESLHGQPLYYRLHGGKGYRHQYSEQELEWLKAKMKNKEAYLLFNNISMYQDALAFQRLLDESP